MKNAARDDLFRGVTLLRHVLPLSLVLDGPESMRATSTGTIQADFQVSALRRIILRSIYGAGVTLPT